MTDLVNDGFGELGDGASGRTGDPDDQPTYKILRYRFNEPTEFVRGGLTLEEAQAHCNDPATQAPIDPDTNIRPWFDGYTREN